ncbi:MAG: hypothetical protein HXY34_13995 [Candidatus Thorarchaeota archaeon]|nr:hypothetical protein [Candidatus Thorarchaeota archaeon]
MVTLKSCYITRAYYFVSVSATSPDRKRLLLLSSLPLIIGTLIANGAVSAGTLGQQGQAHELTIGAAVLQAAISTLVGMLVVLSLRWVLQSNRGARRLAVALLVSPMLGFVSIFIGQSLLLVMFKGAAGVFESVVLVLSLGVSMISIVLLLTDVIPPMLRNFFVAFYGCIFGTFLAITMVTSTMIVLVLSLAIEDVALTRYNPAAHPEFMVDAVGSDPFDYTRVQSQGVTVGVGDYVTFSLVASHGFVFFPGYVWLMSVLLALLGFAVNTLVLAEEGKSLPAIPLPALLSVFPWLVHMVTFALLTV